MQSCNKLPLVGCCMLLAYNELHGANKLCRMHWLITSSLRSKTAGMSDQFCWLADTFLDLHHVLLLLHQQPGFDTLTMLRMQSMPELASSQPFADAVLPTERLCHP